jgi:hypothetical protein
MSDPATAVYPDALMISKRRMVGSRKATQVFSIADIADPILGVDVAKQERSFIRVQPNGKLFVTKSTHAKLRDFPYDTLLFPRDHDRAGESRYKWVAQDDDIEYGYLVEGAEL